MMYTGPTEETKFCTCAVSEHAHASFLKMLFSFEAHCRGSDDSVRIPHYAVSSDPVKLVRNKKSGFVMTRLSCH